jgi:hypothetical protein
MDCLHKFSQHAKAPTFGVLLHRLVLSIVLQTLISVHRGRGKSLVGICGEIRQHSAKPAKCVNATWSFLRDGTVCLRASPVASKYEDIPVYHTNVAVHGARLRIAAVCSLFAEPPSHVWKTISLRVLTRAPLGDALNTQDN